MNAASMGPKRTRDWQSEKEQQKEAMMKAMQNVSKTKFQQFCLFLIKDWETSRMISEAMVNQMGGIDAAWHAPRTPATTDGRTSLFTFNPTPEAMAEIQRQWAGFAPPQTPYQIPLMTPFHIPVTPFQPTFGAPETPFRPPAPNPALTQDL